MLGVQLPSAVGDAHLHGFGFESHFVDQDGVALAGLEFPTHRRTHGGDRFSGAAAEERCEVGCTLGESGGEVDEVLPGQPGGFSEHRESQRRVEGFTLGQVERVSAGLRPLDHLTAGGPESGLQGGGGVLDLRERLDGLLAEEDQRTRSHQAGVADRRLMLDDRVPELADRGGRLHCRLADVLVGAVDLIGELLGFPGGLPVLIRQRFADLLTVGIGFADLIAEVAYPITGAAQLVF